MAEPLRILILEDNPADAELIQFALSEAGIVFTAKVVKTEVDFIHELQAFSPNIILSDYDLPRYNGTFALAEAKKQCPEVPFILVTGAVSEDRAIEILTGGAKDFVMKSRLHKLVPAVRRTLAEAEEYRARKQAEEDLRNAHGDLEVKVRERTKALEAEIEERKKVEESLREIESRERERALELEALLDAAPTPIFIAHDTDCLHLTGNRVAEELLRTPRGSETSLSASIETRPRHFRAVKDGRELSNEELPAQRAARGIPVRDFEFSLVFDDGTTRDVIGYGTPLYDEKGHPRGAVHILVDITERKRAELESRNDRIRLLTALESAGMVTWELDIPTRSILYSDNIQDMIRGADVKPYCTLDELMPLVHPEDRKGLGQALDRASKDGTPFECEYRVHMLDGTYRWILGKGKRVVTEDGKPVRVLGLSMDITERKQTERTLREHEERLRFALETSCTGAWDLDLVDHTAFRSLEHDRIFGYAELLPQWTYEMFIEHVLPEDRDTVDKKYRRAVESRSDWNFECRIRRADGPIRWIWAAGRHRQDATGSHCRMAGIVQDITERKQANETLRQITERLEMAQSAALIGSWDWDLSTGRLEWSTQMFNLFGLDPIRNAASLGVWKSILHSEDIEIAGIRIDQALKEQTTLNSDYRIVLPDGKIRWINAVGKGKYDEQGRPTRMIGVCMDITERKQMEDQLRKAKADLEERIEERTSALRAASLHARSLIEASLDPLVTISTDGKIMDVNHASEEATGITRQKLIGTDFSDYFTEPAKARAGYEKVFREGFVRNYPLEIRHRDGHVIPVLYNASVYRDESGEIMGVFASARDITERKQAEEALQKAYGELEKRVEERTYELTKRTRQLEEANREMESFSYSVSHDLRAPLRAIDGYSRMIIKQQGNIFNENTKRQFDQVMNSARMMGQIIDDLLALSRLGREALSLSILNVDDLARDVWEELKAGYPDSPHSLKIDSIPRVMGDRVLIRQTLTNLLSNAIKFSRLRDVPFIEVGGYSAEGENIYYVRDNGVGFDMQYHDKLFGVFQRLHSSADYEGTGVGLAIVQRIVLRHGGRVWAESEVDKGTTFYFTLPTRPQ